MTEEITWLQLSINGDTAAFEKIVNRYQAMVCAITFSGTGRVDTSEDLAQETFLRAWKNLGQLKDLAGFRAWLCTIARNVLHNHYRQKKTVSLDQSDPDSFSSGSENPSETLIQQEELVMLEQAIMQIPAEYREPLVMFYRQHQSTRDVAESLGLNESTVRTRLHRARQMLREEIAARLERTLEQTAPGQTFTKTVMAGIVSGLAASAAGTASAAASTAAAGTATTGLAAVMSTVTAKIITAAAVVTLAAGSVMVYQSHKEADSPQSPNLQASVVSSQTVSAKPALAAVENSEHVLAVDQPIHRPDNLGENATAAGNLDHLLNNGRQIIQPLDTSLHTETDLAHIDVENQDDSIFSLKIVSQETGRPVAGAQVKARLYGEKEIKAEGVANQFGRYDFRHDKTKFMWLQMTVESEGFVPTKIRYDNESETLKLPLNYTLVLEKGTSIGGVIVDENNLPIQGASVSLLVPRDLQQEQPTVGASIWDYVVKTDKEGQWRCDIMPSKLDDVWIRLSHPEYIDDNTYGATPKPSMESLRAMTGVMVMKKGLTVSGIVMDTDGKPVFDAFVAQGSDRNGSHYPDTRTDKQGRFSFSNAQPGEMILTVTARGMAPDLKPIEVRPELGEIVFHLEPGSIISGRVIDSEGNPIPGAFVAADTWRGHRSNHWRVNTDENGYFQWNEAPKDEVLFDFGKQNYMYVRNEPLTPLSDGRQWEVIMYRPLEVSGTVLDAQTGQPVQSFNLVQGYKSADEGEVWWSTGDTKIFRNGTYRRTYNEPHYGYALKVEADGYLPSVSRVFIAEEETVVLNFALQKGDGVSGIVCLPDGSPAQGAEVMLSRRGISIQDGAFVQKREQPFCQTGPDGRFSFGPQVEHYIIAALHDTGWAAIHSTEFASNIDVVLEPWAQINGTVYVGRNIGAGETVAVNRPYDNDALDPRIHIYSKTAADREGRFAFTRVPAGKLQVSREIKTSSNTSSYTDSEMVRVSPGQTLEVKIGGKGRPVAGRIVLPAGSKKKIDWKMGWVSIATKWTMESPKPTYPDGFAVWSRQEQNEWLSLWRQSDEIKAFTEAAEAAEEQRRRYPVVMNEDGTFRCEGVQAGHYQLTGNFTEPSNADRFMGKTIGTIGAEFDVPQMLEGVSDEVLELGNFEVEVVKDLWIGDDAPDFEYEDADGKTNRLSDYRGKFVLLDIWHRQAREDAKPGLEEMGQLYRQFGHHPHFVMLSVTHKDSTPPALMKQYIEYYKMDWKIGLYQDSKAVKGYAIQDFPGRFLIGPEGKLIAGNLAGQELTNAILKVLAATE